MRLFPHSQLKKKYESQASALPVSGVFAHALELKGVNKQFLNMTRIFLCNDMDIFSLD